MSECGGSLFRIATENQIPIAAKEAIVHVRDVARGDSPYPTTSINA